MRWLYRSVRRVYMCWSVCVVSCRVTLTKLDIVRYYLCVCVRVSHLNFPYTSRSMCVSPYTYTRCFWWTYHRIQYSCSHSASIVNEYMYTFYLNKILAFKKVYPMKETISGPLSTAIIQPWIGRQHTHENTHTNIHFRNIYTIKAWITEKIDKQIDR